MGSALTEMASDIASDFSPEQVRQWRRQVADQRDRLFRQNWKNVRYIPALRSKEEEDAFTFVLEWYEEFGDVVGRQKQRERMDKMIALGVDVNSPPEGLKL